MTTIPLAVVLMTLLSFINSGFSASLSIQLEQEPEKTWLFSTGANRKPYFYEDDAGILQGFTVDLVYKVCKLASKKCAFTLLPFVECVQTVDNHFYPGRGLMAGWFDACPGYDDTIGRQNAVDFTVAFRKSMSRFLVKPGNPTHFNPNNLTGTTITHLTGSATDAQCLKRLGRTGAKIKVASGIAEAKYMVLNGSVDALFSPRTAIPGFDTLPEVLQCAETGTAVMVKRGSSVPSWWNPAFTLFLANGGYKDLCDKSSSKYGVPVKSCFATPGTITTA